MYSVLCTTFKIEHSHTMHKHAHIPTGIVQEYLLPDIHENIVGWKLNFIKNFEMFNTVKLVDVPLVSTAN